jgi:hypothetical protein
VIVKVIDQFHIGSIQPEYHTPVAAHPDRQKTGLPAAKAMQEQAGTVEVRRSPRAIQQGENKPKLGRVVRLDSGFAPGPAAWWGWIPDLLPVLKKASMPLCRKDLIIRPL